MALQVNIINKTSALTLWIEYFECHVRNVFNLYVTHAQFEVIIMWCHSQKPDSPSWLPQSQSGPRTTFTPWKMPLRIIRDRFCLGAKLTLLKHIQAEKGWIRHIICMLTNKTIYMWTHLLPPSLLWTVKKQQILSKCIGTANGLWTFKMPY